MWVKIVRSLWWIDIELFDQFSESCLDWFIPFIVQSSYWKNQQRGKWNNAFILKLKFVTKKTKSNEIVICIAGAFLTLDQDETTYTGETECRARRREWSTSCTNALDFRRTSTGWVVSTSGPTSARRLLQCCLNIGAHSYTRTFSPCIATYDKPSSSLI